ncbi:glycogen debranching N-terminal domain-containing protein [soil metagenome]
MREEAASPEPGSGPVTLVEGSSFCLSGRGGDIRPSLPEGLFFLDTRLLSDWQLRIDGSRPEPLAATTERPDSATFVSRFRSHGSESTGSLVVVRRRVVGRGMREDISVRNHGRTSRAVRIAMSVDVDFADLFDVKLGAEGPLSERTRTTDGQQVAFRHHRGAATRTVTLSFSEPPEWHDGEAVWRVEIPSGGAWTCCAQASVAVGDEAITPRYSCAEPPTSALPATRLASWQAAAPRVDSDHALLTAVADRSLQDLASLRIFDRGFSHRPVMAAGAPWFMTLFGRDSLITAWMALIVDPDITLGVLEALARLQGEESDPRTEEEPGRILHEVRFGESMSVSLGDGHIYYGTADATPLFVMLLGELAAWGHAPEFVAQLIPHADRALAWIEQHGDRGGDGYVEYQRMTERGLRNQGWKDSWDGVPAADGSLPDTPIALCEVQAYVYGAYVARARLATQVGDEETERRCLARAAALRAAFQRDFWLPDRGWYAIGLDADKRPIDALASNMGHCLWTGIVDPEHAPAVARHLLSDEMFSGWGVRTLASSMASYDPLSYHNGSVWPHDNAILAAGLMRYGFVDEAHRVMLAMLDVAGHSGGRLPELFSGIARDDVGVPVAYPTSCSPQAWAAAAPLLFLRLMLRLDPAVDRGEVHCAPCLPTGIGRLTVEGIPLAGRRMGVRGEGDDCQVTGLSDDLHLVSEPRTASAAAGQ